LRNNEHTYKISSTPYFFETLPNPPHDAPVFDNRILFKNLIMKIKPSHILIAALVVHLSALSPLRSEEKPSPAAIQMKNIGKDFKTLSSQISDPAKKESSLAIVDSIRTAVHASKPLVPDPATKLDAEASKQYMREYLKGLEELDAALQDLKKSISADDVPAAQSKLSSINKLKKTYHSDLR
jgi:soluble cytochrome b562